MLNAPRHYMSAQEPTTPWHTDTTVISIPSAHAENLPGQVEPVSLHLCVHWCDRPTHRVLNAGRGGINGAASGPADPGPYLSRKRS